MKNNNKKMIRKLAGTLFQSLLENNPQSLQDTANFLQIFADSLQSSVECQNCLKSPVVSQENKLSVLQAVAESIPEFKNLSDKPADLFKHFFDVVVMSHSASSISEISAAFTDLLSHLNKLVEVNLVSAFDYSQQEIADISGIIQTQLGLAPKIDWSKDSDLIGGAIIKIQDTVLDGSVRGALNNLKQDLL